MKTKAIRHDEVPKKIFGWKTTPAQDVYKQYFARFTKVTNQRVNDHFYFWIFYSIQFNNYTLDCDSSVLTRHGEQKGVKRGYNPHKPSRASHNPNIAFVSDVKLVANMWLRSGNKGSAEGFIPFLEDPFTKLLEKILAGYALIVDSLERKEKTVNYIVTAPFYKSIHLIIAGKQLWITLYKGIEIGELQYKGMLRDKS